MKRIYEPALRSGWEWALPVNEDENVTMVETFGNPFGATWKPVRMKLLKQDERGRPWKEADMPWLGEHLLVLKPRATSALRELCLEAGELLPLTCHEAALVAWNVTTVVDALDEEKSKLVRFPGGRVMSIKQHHFRPEIVEGLTAFRIPQARTSIFVGPAFVDRVREAELTGTRFKEVWPVN
jgi:hypothetical protein